MSEIQFNYKSLPLVVLNNILLSETKSDLRNYALVCKAWVKPVQSILYGDVNIKTISQLEAFENSVTKNLHLGKLVKVFSLSISWSEKTLTKATKRVSNLLYNGLPNLQEFPQSSLDTYAPVLRALKNSRLKMLKVLYPPCKDEEDGYANCILLMDNRVEQIIQQINQFSNLKEIDIRDESYIPSFQTLEHITSTCTKLKKIKFEIGTHSVPEEGVDVFVPSTNIEWLEGDLNNCKALTYIMLKFPQLRALKLRLWYTDLDLKDYARLLTYLSKIDLIDVGRFAVHRRVVGVTTTYWEETSAELGSKSVEVCYLAQEGEGCALGIIKQQNAMQPKFTFVYHLTDDNSQHSGLLDKMGKYLGEFCLVYIADDNEYDSPVKQDLPKKFIDQLCNQCPQLHTLRFEGWVLRARDVSYQDLALHELYFKECMIFGTFFSQLSAQVPHLKRLTTEAVAYRSKNVRTKTGYDDEYDTDKLLEINMPQTEIDTITIIRKSYYRERIPHVKLFVASDKKFHYYRYEDSLFSSNEKEYKEAEEGSRIYVRCLNIPKFEFK